MMRNRLLGLFARLAVIVWVLGLSFAMCGCKTTEDDLANNSERPWNAPKGWDGRLPTQLMEGR